MSFSRAFALPDKQVDNLDALWSAVTGGRLPFPLEIEFVHLDEKNSVVALAR